MSLLVVNGLAKSYGANDVFDNVSLRIEHGDRIGLVGPNGAGKTSLLKVLAGVESSSAGQHHVARGVRIGYLPQDVPPAGAVTLFADLRTVFAALLAEGEALRWLEARMTDPQVGEAELERILAEYGHRQDIFERAGGYHIEQRIAVVLTGLGLPETLWHEPLAHLSGGQRTRALLGRLLLEGPDLLLLDEPTNHLDVGSVEWLEGELLRWKGALVVVSHDRYFLDTVTTRTWELAHHRVETYRGNYSHYRLQREERLLRWRKEYAKQQKFIRETREFIRRYKAGQRTKEAQGRETRLNRFLETEALPPPPAEKRIRLPLRTDTRSGDLVLRTRKLVVGYRGVGDGGRATGDGGRATDDAPHTPHRAPRTTEPREPNDHTEFRILEVPDLEVRRGEVVALIGPNGAGKTTLVRTILGELEPLEGRISLGVGVEIGYLAQKHVGVGLGLMDAGQTVLEALLEVRNLPLERARTYLGQFLFQGDDVFSTIESLSGGQRSRIALARLTLQGANFLLLDEPTNHLDLDSQEILQDALKQFPGTILLVTHDRALVDALATQLWLIEPGKAQSPGALEVFRGTWRQWLRERAGRREAEKTATPAGRTAAQLDRERQRAQRRRRQAAERQAQAVVQLENRIQRMEERLAALEEEMAQASLVQDLERLQKVHNEYQALSQRLERQMEEWAVRAA